MSNPIGAGTAQITYNAPEAESLLLGKVSFDLGISRGQMMREVIAGKRKLDGWVLAFIETIRSEHATLKHATIIALFWVLLAQSVFYNDDSHVRTLRKGRRRDEMAAGFEDSWTSDPMDDIGPVEWATITETQPA